MARTGAGHKYPHVTTDARPHNHAMCPIVAAWAGYAAAGGEDWGTRHDMPALTSEAAARKAKTGFYAARYCKELKAQLGEPVSIQADITQPSPGKYVVWFRVWPRSVAKAEIARRVAAGEQLAYNVLTKGL